MSHLSSLFFLAGSALANEFDFAGEEISYDASPRLFFTNLTSSLVPLNMTILAYGLLAIAVAAALVTALISVIPFLLDNANGSENYYGQYDQYSQYSRSANGNHQLSYPNVLEWISMLQEVYEKFDYNDLECQKRLICEVMKEPEYFGTVAKNFKNGFQYAKYLEVLSLPDELRELLDEYLDANSRADQQKECKEFFTCPYSITDSVKRNLSENNL